MALADSKQAIGAVSTLLKTQLTGSTSVGTVDVGRPDDASETTGHKYNLFLYQVDIDGHLRNQPLDRAEVSLAGGIYQLYHTLGRVADGRRFPSTVTVRGRSKIRFMADTTILLE